MTLWNSTAEGAEGGSAAIEFRQVRLSYPEAESPTLEAVDLTVAAGDLALVIGATGSGKSTLLGLINGRVPHSTGGHLQGSVRVAGLDTAQHRPQDLAAVVGVVGQDPASSFVTDRVEEELAYGVEQLGLRPAVMRKRVEEALDVLGIADLRQRPLRQLSGGQQQRVAIAAVLTNHPGIVVLDEPTSALDPQAAEEVLASIARLVHDLAVTVVVAEHRIERILHHADQLISLDTDAAGTTRVVSGAPGEVMARAALAPPVVQLGRLAGWQPLPLTVRQARRRAGPLRSALTSHCASQPGATPSPEPAAPSNPNASSDPDAPALTARGIRVLYDSHPAVRGVDLDAPAGTVTALMGRNGSGKSSLLWALSGSGARNRGVVAVQRVGAPASAGADPASCPPVQRRRLVTLIPQNATDLLYHEQVGAELAQADHESQAPIGTAAALLHTLAPAIEPQQHPRDLSEGQRLALALAIQLTADPAVLLLDEPTRGLDYGAKARLATLLRERAAVHQLAIVVASHDVEFVAAVSDRVAILADGEIIAHGPTAEVITASPAFAPQISKVLGSPWLTCGQVRAALRTVEPSPEAPTPAVTSW